MKKLLSAITLLSVLFLGSAYAETTSVAKATSFTPVQCAQATLAGAGVTSSANTISLTSFTSAGGLPLSMSNFGTNGYVVLEPNSTSKIENITFTGITQNGNGTAILTGVTRGVTFTFPFIASTTLQKAHAGGSYAICSNPAVFYQNEFVEVNGQNTLWPIASSSPASKGYADFLAFNGAAVVAATTLVPGVSQLATAAQQASSTANNGGGYNLALTSASATDTPKSSCNVASASAGAGCTAIVNLRGALGFPLSSGSTVYTLPTTVVSSSTSLQTDASGNLSWVGNAFTLYNSSAVSASATGASTTLSSVPIAANTFGATNVSLVITAAFNESVGSGLCTYAIRFGNGIATTSLAAVSNAAATSNSWTMTQMYATSTAAEIFSTTGFNNIPNSSASASLVTTNTGSVAKDLTVDLTQKTFIDVQEANTGSVTCALSGLTVQAVIK